MAIYRSIDEAWRAFDTYEQLEPRLRPLWDLCRRAAPPVRTPDDGDDAYGADPFERDPLAPDSPDDGWCAEDFFFEHVKSQLLLLVGAHRSGPPHELQSSKAYDTLYDILVNWALHRPCACCADRGDPWRGDGYESPAYR